MDEFVCKKLTEWGLSELIPSFKDGHIDEESLFCLEDQEIAELIPTVGPRARFKRRLKALRGEQNTTIQETVDSPAQCQQENEEAAESDQVWPSTSVASDKGKRRLDFQLESPASKRQRDTIHGSYTEEIILSDVKHIMKFVLLRLPNQDNKLNKFLKTKISDLETDKRKLVGVFGKTGAGKSSLINAVIGQKSLLPSGSVSACTSVMIKVEANMQNQKYEAEIEFITKEEWKDELWSLINFIQDKADHENNQDEDYRETVDKLSALYGEEWEDKSSENLMDHKYFREIPEFLNSKKKVLSCESAKELSARFVKYTRNDSNHTDIKRWYWPLVKCVTVRVPNNSLLQHVTLVDLPGNGDRNKSRDKMWKEIVGSCSVVWVVTDINRAASEPEPWEILKSASGMMGNGGECQQIHFICTKSDHIEDFDDHSADGVRDSIFQRNNQAKEAVSKEFKKLNKLTRHFSNESFKVFTVSSREFLKKKRLEPEETEIPKLQEFLQNLNDCHSETLNYVSGADGILSLIQGARRRNVAGKANVDTVLEEKIRCELDKVRKPMDEAYKAFVKCLSEGVDKSESSCDKILKSLLHPRGVSGCAFHRTLKCVVENSGRHKPKKKKEMNFNMKLASCLTDSIDEEFKKTFPNERKCGAFNGAINGFSLDTERLIPKYKDVELQLTFLKTEEEKIKTVLSEIIRDYKKTMYSSLTTTIEEEMQVCYQRAAEFRGQDSLKNMRDTIIDHIHRSKATMFQRAMDSMLCHFRSLKEFILKTLKERMMEAIELSLRTDDDSLPDVSVELAEVKKHLNDLKSEEA